MDYFKSDGKFIYPEQYTEFYIPKYYFENKFSEDLGEFIRTFGLLNVGFFSNGNLKEVRVLNLPTTIDLFVNDREDRNVVFPDHENGVDCVVLKYNKGDKIMNDSVVQDSA